jgi:hypothetical protein
VAALLSITYTICAMLCGQAASSADTESRQYIPPRAALMNPTSQEGTNASLCKFLTVHASLCMPDLMQCVQTTRGPNTFHCMPPSLTPPFPESHLLGRNHCLTVSVTTFMQCVQKTRDPSTSCQMLPF